MYQMFVFVFKVSRALVGQTSALPVDNSPSANFVLSAAQYSREHEKLRPIAIGIEQLWLYSKQQQSVQCDSPSAKGRLPLARGRRSRQAIYSYIYIVGE